MCIWKELISVMEIVYLVIIITVLLYYYYDTFINLDSEGGGNIFNLLKKYQLIIKYSVL